LLAKSPFSVVFHMLNHHFCWLSHLVKSQFSMVKWQFSMLKITIFYGKITICSWWHHHFCCFQALSSWKNATRSWARSNESQRLWLNMGYTWHNIYIYIYRYLIYLAIYIYIARYIRYRYIYIYIYVCIARRLTFARNPRNSMQDCNLLCSLAVCFLQTANIQNIDISCVSWHSCAYLRWCQNHRLKHV